MWRNKTNNVKDVASIVWLWSASSGLATQPRHSQNPICWVQQTHPRRGRAELPLARVTDVCWNTSWAHGTEPVALWQWHTDNQQDLPFLLSLPYNYSWLYRSLREGTRASKCNRCIRQCNCRPRYFQFKLFAETVPFILQWQTKHLSLIS